MNRLSYLFLGLFLFNGYYFVKAQTPTNSSKLQRVFPIIHTIFVMKWDEVVIVNDPVGNASDFTSNSNPNLILVSDIHGDLLSVETLQQFEGSFTIITCHTIFEKLPKTLQAKALVLANEEKTTLHSVIIEAIPMYNLTKEKQNFHPKGKGNGNGFVLTKNKTRIYISRDTEGIPEIRALKNINIAFVCINLPYTMDYMQAANTVFEFQPKNAIPYHFRGRDNGEAVFCNVEDFKKIINTKNQTIEVELLDWY